MLYDVRIYCFKSGLGFAEDCIPVSTFKGFEWHLGLSDIANMPDKVILTAWTAYSQNYSISFFFLRRHFTKD